MDKANSVSICHHLPLSCSLSHFLLKGSLLSTLYQELVNIVTPGDPVSSCHDYLTFHARISEVILSFAENFHVGIGRLL